MNKKPIITAIESDNDGYLTITVKGKDAKRVARVVECADEMLEVLERISDTDPDEGSAWFHRVADEVIAKVKGEAE